MWLGIGPGAHLKWTEDVQHHHPMTRLIECTTECSAWLFLVVPVLEGTIISLWWTSACSPLISRTIGYYNIHNTFFRRLAYSYWHLVVWIARAGGGWGNLGFGGLLSSSPSTCSRRRYSFWRRCSGCAFDFNARTSHKSVTLTVCGVLLRGALSFKQEETFFETGCGVRLRRALSFKWEETSFEAGGATSERVCMMCLFSAGADIGRCGVIEGIGIGMRGGILGGSTSSLFCKNGYL